MLEPNKQRVWQLIGAAGVVIGALLAFTPFNLAHVCTGALELVNGRMVPMKCNWSGVAEVILGVVVAVNGLLIILASKGNPRYLVLMLGVLGIAALVTVTDTGIGICMNEQMACHTTKSVINIWGGLLIVLGLGGQFTHLLPVRKGTGTQGSKELDR